MVVEFVDVESPTKDKGMDISSFDDDDHQQGAALNSNTPRSNSEGGSGGVNNLLLEKPSPITTRAKSIDSADTSNTNHSSSQQPKTTRTSWTKLSNAIKLSNVVKTISSINSETVPPPLLRSSSGGGGDGGGIASSPARERKPSDGHKGGGNKRPKHGRGRRLLKEASFARGRAKRHTVTKVQQHTRHKRRSEVSPPRTNNPISIVSKKPEDLLTQSKQVRQNMGFSDFDESAQNRSLSEDEEELFTLKGFEAVEAYEEEPDFNLGDPIHSPEEPLGEFRNKVGKIINNHWIQAFVTALIVANAIILGAMTYLVDDSQKHALTVLETVDTVMLAFFTIEITMQLIYLGIKEFFKNGWMLFDFTIIALSWAFFGSSVSVFRSFRIFRLFAVVSRWTSLRRLFKAVGRTMPKMGTIFAALMLFFYVFCVLYTSLYWQLYPQYLDYNYFGRLDYTFLTLFQFMTLDSWTAVVRQVMEKHEYAWLGFIVWIVITAFFVLNLVVAVICESLIELHKSGDDVHQSKVLKHQQKMMEKQTQALMGGTKQVQSLQREVLANQVAIGTTLVHIMKHLKDETRGVVNYHPNHPRPDYYRPTGGFDPQNSYGTMESYFDDAMSVEDDESLAKGKKPPPPSGRSSALAEQAEEFQSVLDIRDRKYHLRTYKSCFVGSEAIDALVLSGYSKTRHDALMLGRKLEQELRLFKHVTGDHPFADDYYFYRLSNSNASISESRDSHASIPPPPQAGQEAVAATPTTPRSILKGKPPNQERKAKNPISAWQNIAARAKSLDSNAAGVQSDDSVSLDITDLVPTNATAATSSMDGSGRSKTDLRKMLQTSVTAMIEAQSGRSSTMRSSVGSGLSNSFNTDGGGSSSTPSGTSSTKRSSETPLTGLDIRRGTLLSVSEHSAMSNMDSLGEGEEESSEDDLFYDELNDVVVDDDVRRRRRGDDDDNNNKFGIAAATSVPAISQANNIDRQISSISSSSSNEYTSPIVGGGEKTSGKPAKPAALQKPPPPPPPKDFPPPMSPPTRATSTDTHKTDNSSKRDNSSFFSNPTDTPDEQIGGIQRVVNDGSIQRLIHDTTTSAAQSKIHSSVGRQRPRPPPSPTARNKKSIPGDTKIRMMTATNDIATRDAKSDDDNKLQSSPRTGRPPPRGIRTTGRSSHGGDDGGK